MQLEFKKYARKPFLVEAVEVTEKNMETIAELIGTIETRQDGTKFINVDPKKMPNVSRVYPGYWLTRVGKYMRCYKPRLFNERFEVEV